MKDFLLKLSSAEGGVSSKRVLGMICILSYIGFIIVSFFTELNKTQVIMIDKLIYMGSALLGLGLFDGLKSMIKKT